MYTFIRRKKIKDSSVYLSNWFFIKILSAIWFHFRFVFRFISFHWIVFGVDCFNFVSCFDFFLSSESTYFVLCKNFTFDHFSVFIKNVDWMNAWTVFGCTVWNLQAWIGMHFRHVCVCCVCITMGALMLLYGFVCMCICVRGCVHVWMYIWISIEYFYAIDFVSPDPGYDTMSLLIFSHSWNIYCTYIIAILYIIDKLSWGRFGWRTEFDVVICVAHIQNDNEHKMCVM